MKHVEEPEWRSCEYPLVMPKLLESGADVILVGDWLSVRAMRRRNGTYPAKKWADQLTKREMGRLLAAIRVVETGMRHGRPPAGRAVKIRESRHGLWEMRVTPAGGTPPHLRILYLREDRTLWAASGFTKQSNRTAPADVRAADRIVDEWIAGEMG
jgi:Phage derived protein Gp49-like (DUF891)